MEGMQALRKNIDYEKGYDRGYREGYLKALENLPKLITEGQSPIIIVVTEEKYEKLKKDLDKGGE